MKKVLVGTVAALSLTVIAAPGFCAAKPAQKIDGKALFDQHCAACHPNGGNIINKQKTLSKKGMAARGIKTESDIVAKMRNPGPGMNKFDAKQLPEPQAKAIAAYMQKSFP